MLWKNSVWMLIGLLLVSIHPSFAYEWTGAGGNRLWSTPGNWDLGMVPDGTWLWCDVTPLGGGPLIDSEVAAAFGDQMDLGWNGTEAVTVLDMTGGTLTGGLLTVGQYPYAPNYYGAVMNLSGGAVSLSRSFAVGNRTTGVFNMTGGTVDCVGGLQISQGSTTASGTVHLDNGTFTASYIRMCYSGAADGTGHLDLTRGKFVLTDAAQADNVNTYIGRGWITGFGKPNQVKVTPVGSTLEVTSTLTVTGKINPVGYRGDLGILGVGIELRQNGQVKNSLKTVLDGEGGFSISGVVPGTYDVVIKGDTWLQTVVANRLLVNDPEDVGVIDLEGADSNGDNQVSFEDFSLLQNNYGQSGVSAANPLAAAVGGCGPLGLLLMAGLGLGVAGLGLRIRG